MGHAAFVKGNVPLLLFVLLPGCTPEPTCARSILVVNGLQYAEQLRRDFCGHDHYPNNSMMGLPVVREREIPLASNGSLIGISNA